MVCYGVVTLAGYRATAQIDAGMFSPSHTIRATQASLTDETLSTTEATIIDGTHILDLL